MGRLLRTTLALATRCATHRELSSFTSSLFLEDCCYCYSPLPEEFIYLGRSPSLSKGWLLLLVWVVSAAYDCAPSLLFVPSIAVPSRPSRLFWINRSTDLLSLSPPPLADDEAYALHHGDASSTSPSTSLRPKYLASSGVQLGVFPGSRCSRSNLNPNHFP